MSFAKTLSSIVEAEEILEEDASFMDMRRQVPSAHFMYMRYS